MAFIFIASFIVFSFVFSVVAYSVLHTLCTSIASFIYVVLLRLYILFFQLVLESLHFFAWRKKRNKVSCDDA